MTAYPISITFQSWDTYETYYADRFDKLFNESEREVPNTIDDGAYMFDAVWAAALALHNTAKKLPMGQSLLDFDYSSTVLSESIYEEALNVNFFGLTVSIYNYLI